MFHKSHMRDAMTCEEINAKLDMICAGVVGQEQRERIREAWWNVADAGDIGEPIQTMVGFRDLEELDQDIGTN